MIRLYIFPPAVGLRNPSPFCVKVEMALRHLNLDYEVELLGDPRKAPKGKLPFMELNEELVADSELIIERLDRHTSGGLFGDLTRAELALGTAFTRLAEDHLYWLMVASRWLDDDWWPNIKRGFFGAVPGPLRAIVAPVARRQVRRAYYLHGLGRHSLEEQKHFANRDLQAISHFVEESSFVASSRMTVFDFAVAAQLASFLDHRPASWLSLLAGEYPALTDYAERIQAATGIYARKAS